MPLIPLKHNHSWYIGTVLSLGIWCCYVGLFSIERVFLTSSGLGKISFGLTKACLYDRWQEYVPEGCYAYDSSYGELLSNDCDVKDSHGDSIGFCPKRKAGAAFALMGCLATAASLAGSVAVIFDARPKFFGRLALIPHAFSCGTSFLGIAILASMNGEYDEGDLPGDPKFEFGASYWLLVTVFILHILQVMFFAHALLESGKVIHTSARQVHDIATAGKG